MAIDAPYLTACADGVRLMLKVTPRAKRAAILGPAPMAAGLSALSVAVTAAPQDGKANAAVVRLLARETGIARSRFEVVAGAGGRRKTLLVRGDPQTLLAAFRDLTAPPTAAPS